MVSRDPYYNILKVSGQFVYFCLFINICLNRGTMIMIGPDMITYGKVIQTKGRFESVHFFLLFNFSSYVENNFLCLPIGFG